METIIFGGTFDPPTTAHQAIIERCILENPQSEVWVMPSGQRADKPCMQPNEVRLHMARLMCQPFTDAGARVCISDFEQRLPQPNETYNTLRALERAYPERTFKFVFGVDSYETMETWKNGEEMKRTMGMLLVPRAGYQLSAVGENVTCIDMPEVVDMALSSTVVRSALSQGEPISGMVPQEVEAFLTAEVLYT